MGRLATISTCQLNQWALDFDGNRDRILEAIRQAKADGSKLILTPELCIPGYGLLDHFQELDTFSHSWEVLAEIISSPEAQGIIIDLGLPVRHNDVPHNARVLALNGQILAIRPKIDLCNDGNYREMRYFTPWTRYRVDTYTLPLEIQELTGQAEVPIGDIIFQTLDATFASELCEELWTPDSPHIQYCLNGAEIILNSSGSHHELRKLDTRINLITNASKSGGVYMYSNQRGCDGDRLYYDGCSLIAINGQTVAQGSQFSLRDVEVITSTVDLDDIWSARQSRSRGMQAMKAHEFKRVKIDFAMTKKSQSNQNLRIAKAIEPRYHKPEEEIALGPACWLWDYLRRSGAAGYFVPLSGGIDSCATATIVFSMCRLVIAAIKEGDEQVIKDATRLCAGSNVDVSKMSAQDFCGRIFSSAFMGMKEQSSKETRSRAQELAEAIGANHIDCNIDEVFNAVKHLVSTTLSFEPKFKVHGGSQAENLALQNFQSRTRMILSYAFGQLLPTTQGRTGGLLVLGSANVDEALRGYLTKYDCSSADINPIGGISKTDLIRFIAWAEHAFELPILQQFIDATPTAELEPITSDYVQSDEVDMGMTYKELSVYGYLRKVRKFGVYSMWEKLCVDWQDQHTPREVYKKVRDFMYYYAVNRHKMTTITPAYYAEQYAPDDNRYDLRPFLYPRFTFAHRKIENELKMMEAGEAGGAGRK
jgi:NAD+ synthase (glutamine-hydrolysing)